MPARIQQTRSFHLFRIRIEWRIIPEALRNRCRAESAEEIGYGFWVSGHSEEALDTRANQRWEKILQVHLQNNALIDMRRDESMDGSPLDEPRRRGVGRDSVQH